MVFAPESTFSMVPVTTFVEVCAACKAMAQNMAARTSTTWKPHLNVRDDIVPP
jgi:hypothetical protein